MVQQTDIGVFTRIVILQHHGITFAKIQHRNKSRHDLRAGSISLEQIFQPLDAPQQQHPQYLTGLTGHRIRFLAHDTLEIGGGWRQSAVIPFGDPIQRFQQINGFMLIAIGLIPPQRFRLLGKQATADLVSRLQSGDSRANLIHGLLALALDQALPARQRTGAFWS